MKDPIRQPEVERCFATAMIDVRREDDLTQADLAGKLTAAGRPMKPANITHFETGRSRITLADAVLIADLFGMDVLQMLEHGRRKREFLTKMARLAGHELK